MSDLLTAGAGVLGSVVNGIFGNVQQNREFAQQEKLQTMANDFSESMWNKQAEFNKSEREAAQDWNLEMWNKANEYNSPQAQLQRAMEAGINPNAVFGNGQYGSVQASPVTTQGSTAGLAGAAGVGSVPSIANAMAGLGSNVIDNMGKLVDVAGQQIQNRYAPMLNEAQLDNLKADVGKKIAEKEYTQTQRDVAIQMCDIAVMKNEKDLAKADEEIKQIQQNIENMKTQQSVMSAQTEYYEAQTRSLNYDVDYKMFQKTMRDTLGIDLNSDLGLQLLALWKKSPEDALAFVSDTLGLIVGVGGEIVGDVANGVVEGVKNNGGKIVDAYGTGSLGVLGHGYRMIKNLRGAAKDVHSYLYGKPNFSAYKDGKGSW